MPEVDENGEGDCVGNVTSSDPKGSSPLDTLGVRPKTSGRMVLYPITFVGHEYSLNEDL